MYALHYVRSSLCTLFTSHSFSLSTLHPKSPLKHPFLSTPPPPPPLPGMDLKTRQNMMNKCPLTQAIWCVISPFEMHKCQNMMMAFSARKLKPDLNCIRGDSAIDCIRKISVGDADLISLDAADVFTAGKYVWGWR